MKFENVKITRLFRNAVTFVCDEGQFFVRHRDDQYDQMELYKVDEHGTRTLLQTSDLVFAIWRVCRTQSLRSYQVERFEKRIASAKGAHIADRIDSVPYSQRDFSRFVEALETSFSEDAYVKAKRKIYIDRLERETRSLKDLLDYSAQFFDKDDADILREAFAGLQRAIACVKA